MNIHSLDDKTIYGMMAW